MLSRQPVVLRDGLLAANGALGRVGGLRVVLRPVGREHARSFPDGGVLAAVRMVSTRLFAPPGLFFS